MNGFTSPTGLTRPYGIALDSSGNLFVANFGTNTIEKFSNIGTPQSVPEPFTIIGTLVGGTAAIRMRKKLKLANKN